jgi:hypothetical protein
VDVAALVTWILTAGGGFVLLTIWLSRSRARSTVGAGGPASSGREGAERRTRFPAALVLGHAGLAVVGLLLWIAFVAGNSATVARVALVVILVVAVLGFTMLARWVRGGGPRHADADARAENAFPVPVVAAHGVLAAVTLVLVLVAALRT